MAAETVDNRVQRDPSTDAINDPILSKQTATRETSLLQPDLVIENPHAPTAQRTRQLIRWRVPGLGFVDMYINPQQIRFVEKKIIQKQRTKGGYVIQYWGEELAEVHIEGTTGSSGIEGINILRKVYRAEQDAFQKVAQSMQDRLQEFTIGGSLTNLIGGAASKDIAGSIIGGLFGGGPNPPLLPTLGSLAVAVELFYQGWVLKGYFDDFSVTEGVAQGVGVFQYTMKFTVLDRRGTRVNFMPWHRSPATIDANTGKPVSYNKADSKTAPPNFSGEE